MRTRSHVITILYNFFLFLFLLCSTMIDRRFSRLLNLFTRTGARTRRKKYDEMRIPSALCGARVEHRARTWDTAPRSYTSLGIPYT